MLDILEYYLKHPEKKLGLIFLDAQKAFDNVNWNFILEQLESMHTGDSFSRLIKAIYSQQKAKIKVNGDLSEEIMIEKGVGKAAHYPLLILMLEILNNVIRSDPAIKGTKIKGEEFKLLALF